MKDASSWYCRDCDPDMEKNWDNLSAIAIACFNEGKKREQSLNDEIQINAVKIDDKEQSEFEKRDVLETMDVVVDDDVLETMDVDDSSTKSNNVSEHYDKQVVEPTDKNQNSNSKKG